MPQESITLQAENGVTKPGRAEVFRYSNANRIIRASLWVIAGLFGGTACIIVPVVHLFTTWGFPLLGIFMAVRTIKREVSIHQVEGTCPICDQPIDIAGGALIDQEWQMCQHCKEKLTFRADLGCPKCGYDLRGTPEAYLCP